MRIVFALFLFISSAAHAMPLPGGGQLPAATLPTVQLSTTLAGTNNLPVTIGQAFVQGAVTGAVHLNASVASSCTVMQTWPDGSDKHAICALRTSLTSGTPTTLSFIAGSGSAATPLACSDIQTANPSASVTISTASPSTITLASVIASPIRTWISNAEMVECHYKATASNGLLVFFYVRLYQDGRVYVRETVDNGWVDQDLGNLAFTLTGTIGGSAVYGPTALTLYHYTRWTATGWINGDPQITPKHDTAYLVSTKLIPNYFMDTPTSTKLNGLYQTYTYATAGDGDANEPGTGAQFQIGLLPGWEALYITSLADSRTYKAAIANAAQEFSFPILFRGQADSDLIVRPSIYPGVTGTCPGSGGGGSNDGCGFSTPASPTPLTWDTCHSSGAGYIPYMITGEYFYAELLQAKAATAYLADGSGLGSGTSRSVFHVAVRCPSWHMRTMGLLAALVPATDSVTSDYKALLVEAATESATRVGQAGQNALGILYEYDLFQGGPPHCHGTTGFIATCSLFMEFFMAQTYGFLSDLQPLGTTDMAHWNTARDYLAKIPVNLLGSLSGTDYCYSWAAGTFDYTYNATQNLNSETDPNFAASWGAVYNLGATTSGQTCTNTLQGTSGSDPATGATSFWANLLPAASLAVDHSTTGMQAGINRLTGASNYSTFRNATGANSFADNPQFGIQPRGQHI